MSSTHASAAHSVTNPVTNPAANAAGSSTPHPYPLPSHQWFEFCIDAWQRNILFWDVLRQRSEQFEEESAKKAPNVLHFSGEVLIDGRTLPRPVNYGLVRIIPPAGVHIDLKKRPFVVIDPRAGHGPGIGGFKADSEIGVALAAGHPCYFVGFTPQPEPGQTIEDVMHAEAAFVEEVIRLHPEAEGKPCIIGNCQAGWAVMMLAATRPELCGPIIIPGAPLSYWAGIEGVNPMRYSGGLLGGSWLTTLTSDLGQGKFDGGWLVSNFENLDPANTYWKKLHNLWAKVDTEGPRFLEFERWWGNHVTLNGEEIQWIVDQLFIGNRLATAEIITEDGVRIDLRNIRSPIVCFCSQGDNITPPQQALGWITDLYSHDDQIRANGQTIIYALHDDVGHLGIFVSGKVALKEHQEFATNIDLIDILPPGLYQAVIRPKTPDTPDAEFVKGDWIVHFEPRTLEDIRAIVQPSPENERRFAAVRQVSEINLGLYRTLLQPVVRHLAAYLAALIPAPSHASSHPNRLHPPNLAIELFSDQNPFMPAVAHAAKYVRETRRTIGPNNPFWSLHTALSDSIAASLDLWRDWRDSQVERLFLGIYDAPVTQALLGLRASEAPPRQHPGFDPDYIQFIHTRIAELNASMNEGTPVTAAVRALVYVMMGSQRGVDERAFNVLLGMRRAHAGLTLDAFKQAVREQFFRLILDEEQALAALPGMLPEKAAEQARLFENIQKVAETGEIDPGQHLRLARIEKLFNLASSPKAPAVPAIAKKTETGAGRKKT